MPEVVCSLLFSARWLNRDIERPISGKPGRHEIWNNVFQEPRAFARDRSPFNSPWTDVQVHLLSQEGCWTLYIQQEWTLPKRYVPTALHLSQCSWWHGVGGGGRGWLRPWGSVSSSWMFSTCSLCLSPGLLAVMVGALTTVNGGCEGSRILPPSWVSGQRSLHCFFTAANFLLHRIWICAWH